MFFFFFFFFYGFFRVLDFKNEFSVFWIFLGFLRFFIIFAIFLVFGPLLKTIEVFVDFLKLFCFFGLFLLFLDYDFFFWIFLGHFGFFFKLPRFIFKVTKVITGHQRWPKNWPKKPLAKGRSPLEELEVGLRSGLYLLVLFKAYI